MKFIGEPNLTVIDYRAKKVLFKFDTNGEFETTDEKLIERLKPHFKTKPQRKSRLNAQ